jgi:Zn finger protein HypA/HybF involved in hydrogenase expression
MTQNQNQTSAATKKISTYLTLIVLIVVVLAIVALILAASLYYSGDYTAAGILAVIGLIALTMSTFTLFQSQRQAVQMKIEIPKVMTTIECKKCGTKTVREYQRGDYVYKELDACPKCPDTKQIITAIYKEVKEKEKTYNV